MKKLSQKIRRNLAAILAVIIAMMSVNVPVFAAETTTPVQKEEIDEISTTSSRVDNTFTMGSYHRGGDRKYSTNTLYIRAIITDTSGNATDNNVAIALQDYNGNVTYWNVPADGGLYGKTFNIVAGRTYYMEYYRSGTARNLKLHIIIDPV